MSMKLIFIFLFSLNFAHAQYLWERSEQKTCVETKTNVDDVRNNLKEKFKKHCDYLKDATRIVIGNFFKCPDDKMYSYFRTKEACELFFSDEKKELHKFAPNTARDVRVWAKAFGKCMETATPGQLNQMGPQWLNSFCYCVAGKTKSTVNAGIIQQCSKELGAPK